MLNLSKHGLSTAVLSVYHATICDNHVVLRLAVRDIVLFCSARLNELKHLLALYHLSKHHVLACGSQPAISTTRNAAKEREKASDEGWGALRRSTQSLMVLSR
eukprot:8137392-Pyramimonas_sp.AAC.1